MKTLRLWVFAHLESKDPKSACDKWRRVAEIVPFGFQITQEVHIREGDWFQSHIDGWGFFIDLNFSFRSTHLLYDGEHCSFSLGFLHLHWSTPGCRKCMLT